MCPCSNNCACNRWFQTLLAISRSGSKSFKNIFKHISPGLNIHISINIYIYPEEIILKINPIFYVVQHCIEYSFSLFQLLRLWIQWQRRNKCTGTFCCFRHVNGFRNLVSKSLQPPHQSKLPKKRTNISYSQTGT